MNKIVILFFFIFSLNSIPALDLFGGGGFTYSAFENTAPGFETLSDDWNASQSAHLYFTLYPNDDWYLQFSAYANLDPGSDSELLFNLDQFFVSWFIEDLFELTVGRQQLGWGPSLLFRSIDMLEDPDDLLDDKKDSPGVSGGEIVYFPNEWASLSLVAIPGVELEETRAACRIDMLAGETDLAIGAATFIQTEYIDGPGLSTTLANSKTNYSWSAFADVIHYFERIGLYAEAVMLNGSRNDFSYSSGGNFLSGLSEVNDFRFGGTLGIIWFGEKQEKFVLEYHYNGEGYSADEAELLYTHAMANMALYNSRSISSGNFGRHYAGFSVSNIELGDWFLSFWGRLNIDALSGIGNISFTLPDLVENGDVCIAYQGMFESNEDTVSELSFYGYGRNEVSISFSLSF